MSVRRSTSRSGRFLRRAAAAVAFVTVALTVSACDPREAGSAALVGGYRVTETTVQNQAKQVIAGIQRLGGQAPDNGALLTALVNRLVRERLFERAGAKENVVVTQGQVDALIEKSGGRKALEDKFLQNSGSWTPASSLDEQARVFLIQTALAEKLAPNDTAGQAAAVAKYLVDLATAEGVQIAPRYGTWDPATIGVGPVSDDLSRPAIPTPAASPSPSG